MNLGLVTATHLGRIWLFPNFEPRWSELENRYQPRAKFLEFQCGVENLRSGQLRIAFTVRLHQFYNLARRGFRRQSSQAETPPGRVRSMISTCTTTLRSTRSTMRGFKRRSLRALTLWGPQLHWIGQDLQPPCAQQPSKLSYLQRAGASCSRFASPNSAPWGSGHLCVVLQWW